MRGDKELVVGVMTPVSGVVMPTRRNFFPAQADSHRPLTRSLVH